MLMMFTLLMYSMLSVGVEWYESSPLQPLDPWKGRPPKRRLGEMTTRFWGSCRALRLAFPYGACWHLLVLTETHWFEPWARSESRLLLLLRDWFIWWRLAKPHASYSLMTTCHRRARALCVPLYISVGCSGRQVPSVILDNGSTLNVCPLATAIALNYPPSDLSPSTVKSRLIKPSPFHMSNSLEQGYENLIILQRGEYWDIYFSYSVFEGQ